MNHGDLSHRRSEKSTAAPISQGKINSRLFILDLPVHFGQKPHATHASVRLVLPKLPSAICASTLMFTYGKTATNAIAVMSYLAAKAPHRVGSAVIGNDRDISPVFTAKLLSRLASAGYLNSQPGPGGGYALSKDPAKIRLIEIVALFEQLDEGSRCPFGTSWCGHSEPCPLHDTITDLGERNRRFLEDTRLSVFQTRSKTSKPQRTRLKKSAKKTSGTQPRRSAKPSS